MSFRSLGCAACSMLLLLACQKQSAPEPTKSVATPSSEAKPGSPSGAANPHAAPDLPAGHPKVGSAGSGGAPGSSGGASDLGVQWTTPEGWQELPSKSPMRKATYKVPGAAGDGELSVFYFGPNQGGTVDANIDRWVGQFSDVKPGDVKRTTKQANGLDQHIVQISTGTFSGGMSGGGPAKDSGLLGAVVQAPTGMYFFKLTGPAKTLDAQAAAFEQFLASMKPKS